MDFLGQSVNQIRDLFRTMTPAARITSALLLGVIVVSLGYLVRSHTSGPSGYLFNGASLEPREADRVLAAIDNGGLTGAVREGNKIRVPHGREAEYMGAVMDAGALPANFDTLMVDSLDSSLFTSSTVQKEQIKSVREQKISMLLREMAGVADAKVMYAVSGEGGGRSFAKQRKTATVSVLPDPTTTFTSQQLKMIRKAVASANGMSPEDVALLNQASGAELVAGGRGDADFDDPYFSTLVKYENYVEQDIRELLSYIPGVGVQVAATLNPQLSRKTQTVTTQGEGTPIRETTEQETVKNTRTENSGRPGVFAQGPGRNGANKNVAQSSNETTIHTTDLESLVPRSDTYITESGLTPERVTAAIKVPRSYLVEVWRQRQKEADPDFDVATFPADTDLNLIQTSVTNDITEAVTRLIPRIKAEDNYKNVSVTFPDALKADPIEPPSGADEALQWASQNFSTMIMAGVALMSLAMLRSLVKSIPPSDPVASLTEPSLALAGMAEEEASRPAGEGLRHGPSEGDAARPRLRLNKGPSLKDDLTDIVREDPDAAAAILRSWIGNAG